MTLQFLHRTKLLIYAAIALISFYTKRFCAVVTFTAGATEMM